MLRLHEANTAQIYLHGLDEFQTWLEENERLSESEDHGKDLSSVAKLLKKLEATETDIFSRFVFFSSFVHMFPDVGVWVLGILGTGQLGPGARLSGAQFA